MQGIQITTGVFFGIMILVAMFTWMSMRGEVGARRLAPLRVRLDDKKRRRPDPRQDEDHSAITLVDMFFGFLILALIYGFLISLV